MGFFSDLRKLKQQGDAINANWDPAAQMRAGTEQLRQVQQSLEADAELHRIGAPGTATILGLVDTGTRINLQPMVRLSLMVQRDGLPPYPVTFEAMLPLHASAQAGVGQRVSVLIHPHQADRVLVRWGHPV